MNRIVTELKRVGFFSLEVGNYFLERVVTSSQIELTRPAADRGPRALPRKEPQTFRAAGSSLKFPVKSGFFPPLHRGNDDESSGTGI